MTIRPWDFERRICLEIFTENLAVFGVKNPDLDMMLKLKDFYLHLGYKM